MVECMILRAATGKLFVNMVGFFFWGGGPGGALRVDISLAGSSFLPAPVSYGDSSCLWSRARQEKGRQARPLSMTQPTPRVASRTG